MGKQRGILILLAVMLASFLIRSFRLTEPAVWFDESFSIKMASFSLSEIWQRSGYDTHPPLYFLLLKIWMLLFGKSVFATRGLSVLLGTGTSVLAVLFVQSAYPETEPESGRQNRSWFAAGVAGLLVSLGTLQITWSMQIRMYVLLAFLALLSSWLLVRAHRSRTGWYAWGAFTFSCILLSYTHVFGVISAASMYLFSLLVSWKSATDNSDRIKWGVVRPSLLSALAVAVVWLPWLGNVIDQQARVADDFWSTPVDWDWIGRTFSGMVLAWNWGPDVVTTGLWVAQGFALTVLLLLLGRRRFDGLVAVAAVFPFASGIAISLLVRNIMVDRYFVAANVFLLIVVALLLSRIAKTPLRWLGTMAVFAGMLFCFREYWSVRLERSARPGMREALSRFERLRGDGELLVVCNPMLHTSAIMYAQDAGVIRTWGSEERYPFYHGTAVMCIEEYFDEEDLDEVKSDWVWILDTGQWADKVEPVPIPVGWERVSEVSIREWYCELILRLYRRSATMAVSKTRPVPSGIPR